MGALMVRQFAIVFCMALLTVWGASTTLAQAPAPAAAPDATAAAATPPVDGAAAPADAAPVPAAVPAGPFLGSLMFTDLERTLIRKAASGQSIAGPNVGKTELIPVDRKIWLGAVFYRNPHNWILWLNGHKLTPHRLLPEIMGIKVEGERVDLEWFDIGKNGVINVTMRPNQIYDIVTGLMLYDTDGGK
jgi:hypothetical protein